MVIKNEETFDLELKENVGNSIIKRNVKIKNGKVVEIPKDVEIIGENTPEGFIIHGLKLKKKREENNYSGE